MRRPWGGEPGRVGTGVLRAQHDAGPGLAQRRTYGPAEDGGGVYRIRGASSIGPRRAVSLGDSGSLEGTGPGARGLGGRSAGPRSFSARHRGCLQGRDGAAFALKDGGVRDRRAAVGGLPGVRDPGLGEYDIVYLFIDSIAERIRPGQKREPVLAAWGFTATGAKEDAEASCQRPRPMQTKPNYPTLLELDRCRGNAIPLVVKRRYDFHQFGCHLGNVE